MEPESQVIGNGRPVVVEEKPIDLTDYKKIHAIFLTSLGSFKVVLNHFECPETVKNFVELAMGKKSFFDDQTGNQTKRPFYEGLVFHRVIKKHFIQGGDPAGNGRGGPGYMIKPEPSAKMKFDTPGRLAAVASGDGVTSNGSQFFITVDKAEWLDPAKTTVFGQVVSGLDTVRKIAKVPTDALDRPKTAVKIESIEIELTEWPVNQGPPVPATVIESSTNGVVNTPPAPPAQGLSMGPGPASTGPPVFLAPPANR